MEEKKIDRKRSIGQVGKELGLPDHVIRFWETQFSQIKPKTGKGNRRYYYEQDVQIISNIKYYLYEEGYTIKGLQKLLDKNSNLLCASYDDNSSQQDEEVCSVDSIKESLSNSTENNSFEDKIESLSNLAERINVQLNSGKSADSGLIARSNGGIRQYEKQNESFNSQISEEKLVQVSENLQEIKQEILAFKNFLSEL